MSALHTDLTGTRWQSLSLGEQLTIADPRHSQRLKELTRLREALLDYFFGSNEFGSSDSAWRRYFNAFGVAAALERHRA